MGHDGTWTFTPPDGLGGSYIVDYTAYVGWNSPNRDHLDPATEAPRAEIEAAKGNPVTLLGNAASREQLTQRCHRIAEQALVRGARRPDGDIEHLGPIGTQIQHGSQRWADLARRQLSSRGELEPGRGDTQPDQITGPDAQRRELTGL